MVVEPSEATSPGRSIGRSLAALLVFGIAALFVYQGALTGGPVTDDVIYLSQNPYVRDFDVGRALAILDPTGGPAMYVTNYSPVTLLAHAATWAAFGSDWAGHHLVNVVLHALVAVLFAALLRRHGASEGASWLAAAILLLHPGQVEAVAWMSQLKTLGAMVLALGALLALPARPAWSTLLFALALLTKAQAAAALPFAAVWAWQSRPALDGDDRRARPGASPRWVLGWLCVFGLYAATEIPHFSAGTASAPVLHEDPLLRAANIAVIGARYVAMAATTWGIGAFQQPDAIESWLSPWIALALVVHTLLAWLWLRALRTDAAAARWWTLALASFAPVSQVFPFLYPVADRYLYFILPGLLGGVVLTLEPLVRRRGPAALRMAAALGALIVVACGALGFERAALWSRPALVLADSVRLYPDGVTAHLLRARNASSRGAVDLAVDELEAARRRGFNGLSQLQSDPAYGPARGHPRFEALLRALAREWVERFEAIERPNQLTFKSLASSYLALGDTAAAIDALDRGIAHGGPLGDELQTLRSQLSPADARR